MRWVVVLAGLAAAGPALAADRIGYGPPAAWVSTAPITATPLPAKAGEEDAAQPALSFLEMDSQSKFTATDITEFSAFKVRIDTVDGLTIGGFTRSWDPATDNLTIHRLRIERDGKVIDVLRQQKFETLRRERNLEQAMLDGRLTATLQIADLRVGDVLDFAMTLTRAQPVLAGRNSSATAFSPLSKVGKTRVRLVWDAAAPVRWRAGSGLPAPQTITTPTGGEMLFEAAEFKGPMPPEMAPVTYRNVGLIDATQVNSWEDVSKAFAPIYARAAKLSPTSPLKAEVERIRRTGKTPLEQASLALQLVEDQIRYVAIGMNAQGFIPAAADETWRRRFGDCKGKTALLMALLQELGIEATPVLVNIYGDDNLLGVLPRGAAFDHVIVRARIDGAYYWLDGTRSGDKDLAALEIPNHGWGLPVLSEGAGLTQIEPPRPIRPEGQHTLRIDASKGLDRDTPVELEVLMRGDDLAAAARQYGSISKADAQRLIISAYSNSYKWVNFTRADWRYDPARSTFVMTLKGVGSPDVRVTNGVSRFEIPGSAVGAPDIRLRPAEQDANAPYELRRREFTRSLTLITLPGDGEGYRLDGAPLYYKLGGVRQTRWAFKSHAQVWMLRSLRGVDDELTAEQMAKDVAAARRFRSSVSVLTWGGPSKPVSKFDETKNLLPGAVYSEAPPIDPSVVASAAAVGEAQALLRQAREQALAGDAAKALQLLNETKLDLRPVESSATTLRIQLLSGLKRDGEAIALADKAIAVKPDPSVLFARAGIHTRRGDEAAAMRDIAQTLALQPQNAVLIRAHVDLLRRSKNYAAAMAEQRKLVQIQPDEPGTWVTLGLLETKLGNFAAAEAAYADALEAGSSEVTVRVALAEMLLAQQRTDEAIKEYELAVATAPENPAVLNQACWSRAIRNVALDRALANCEKAVSLKPDNSAYRDSLAFVKLRQGRVAEAIADYDAALKLSPDLPASLYGRGIARVRAGQSAAGQEDLAKARRAVPRIDETFADYGVTP